MPRLAATQSALLPPRIFGAKNRPMKIDGTHYRSIWPHADGDRVEIIDQTRLPYEFGVLSLSAMEDAAHAIRVMQVRGAPLIGATAAMGGGVGDAGGPIGRQPCRRARGAWGDAAHGGESALGAGGDARLLAPLPPGDRAGAAWARAGEIGDEDVEINHSIGQNGLALIREIAAARAAERVNLLTHCNAGWLATVDWGTATAPIYLAHEAGIDSPCLGRRNPAAEPGCAYRLGTGQHGVPHTYIADNAGGHLMQHGMVDMVITGTDRVAANGDVCQQDRHLSEGAGGARQRRALLCRAALADHRLVGRTGRDIPIEERGREEWRQCRARGRVRAGQSSPITPPGSPVANPAFDVTPARLVTGLITERGVAAASPEGLAALFPEMAA